MKAVVDKWLKIMEDQISLIVENPYDIIYSTEIPLDGRDIPIRSSQTNLGNLIAKSMAFSYDNEVDCSLVNGGSIRIDDQLIGDINSLDIFRVLPFGGPVLKVKIKGVLLKRVIEFGEHSAGSGDYLQRSNIEIKKGQIFINQNKLIDSKIYTIAISDYLMKGLDIPFLISEHPDIISVYSPNINEVSFDIRKAVISFLKK